MTDLTPDALLALGKDPAFAKNAIDIMGMLKEANGLLHEAQKTSKLLDSLGVKTLLVRGAANKYNIDIDTPLKEDKSVLPKSDLHKITFEQLNNLSEPDLAEVLKRLQLDDQEQTK